MSLQDDTSSVKTAVDFLRFIYPIGPWTITSIIDNPDPNASNPVIIRGRTFHERQIGDLTRYIEDLNGKVNLYWQVNPLRIDPGNKAKLQDVKEIARLHVDIDPRKGTHDRERERELITSLLEDEKRLKAMGLPGGPSLIVDSGNGFWGFWDLIEPIALSGNSIEELREHAADIGRYNRWIAEVFNAELKGELGDQCHNVDRISRLPGTLNIPDAKKRAAGFPTIPAHIYANYRQRLYSLDQFNQSDVISWGAGATEEDFQRVQIGEIIRLCPRSTDPWEIGQELKRQYPQVGEKILELITLGEYLDDREAGINDKITPQGLATNRSKAHWRVNRSLQQYGVPLNVILGILCDERLPISAHGREPIDEKTGRRSALRSGRELIRFNEHQIRKCTVSIAKQRAEEERAEALLADAPEVEAPGSAETINDAPSGGAKAQGPKKKQPGTSAEVVKELNERHAVLLQEGGKTRVLCWSKSELEGDNREIAILQTFADFKNRYMNRMVATGTDKNGTPTYKDWGEIWLKNPKRREFLEMRFLPGQPAVVDGYLNLWRGFACEPTSGNWSLMKNHILTVLAEGNEEYNEYILNWAAWAVQNPDKQAEVALVFRGNEGTGKGIFARALKYMFGQHGLQINSTKHLVGNFNSHLRDCCLLFADEAIAPGLKKEENILKGLITEPEIPIERKGFDVKPTKSHLHIVMCSNEEWVVPASIDARRFAIFNASSIHKQDEPYFKAIIDQMNNGGQSAMLHELLNRKLGSWHPRNNIPQTEALREQKERSLSPINDVLFEILQDGFIPGCAIPNNELCFYSYVKDSQEGLLSQLRIMEPRLRNASDKVFAKAFKDLGCRRVTKYNQRGWQFPKLDQMRSKWEEVMNWKHAWDPHITEWSNHHHNDNEDDEHMPF